MLEEFVQLLTMQFTLKELNFPHSYDRTQIISLCEESLIW